MGAEFKCLGCMVNDKGTNVIGCKNNKNGRIAPGAIRVRVNAKRMQLMCASVFTKFADSNYISTILPNRVG